MKTRFLMVPVLVFALLLSQSACDKQSLVSWSEKAVSGLNRALPLLENAGVSGARIREAVSIGNQLVVAFKANDNESALRLASSFIVAFEGVIADTERISNPATRTIILVVLSVVDLALHQIADSLEGDAPRMSPGLRRAPALANLSQYRARKRFSCRASGPVERFKAGQYMPMEMCKKFPNNSQVETR